MGVSFEVTDADRAMAEASVDAMRDRAHREAKRAFAMNDPHAYDFDATFHSNVLDNMHKYVVEFLAAKNAETRHIQNALHARDGFGG